jgi:aryl-alcohol dehydrogenase-like predicted oxidoreductase
MKTDYIDLWQGHSADADTLAQSDVPETLLRIKQEGKVRHIAMSIRGGGEKYGYPQLLPYLDNAWDIFETFQVWYSAFVRHSEDVIAQLAQRGKGVIIRGVMRSIDPWIDLDDAVAKLRLNDLLGEGEAAPQFLLRWAISQPGVHAIIVGSQSLTHIAENIAAIEAGPLPADIVQESKRRLDLAGIRAAKSSSGMAMAL